eukprot:Hpha_TRINITY_DN15973_c0_g2::TRINITY_DN15973_c0_g2_i1::g.74572::m.74572/K03850/ALG10; alpha-1,2-glucosyltransferase
MKTLSCAIAAAAGLVTAAVISRAERLPYMDEEFHYRQTKTYLAGNWSEWDPKITTPPGLYLAGVAWVRMWELLPQDGVSELELLRGLSGALVGVCCWALHVDRAVSSLLGWAGPEQRQGLAGLVGCFLPFFMFFGGMYYTDVLSAACVFATLRLVAHGQVTLAALATAAATMVRQTNAVFCAFAFGCAVVRELELKRLSSLLHPRTLVQCVWALCTKYFAFLVVVAACLVAAKVNGGIVLGDKTNHTAVFHPTQLVYLACVVAIFMPTLWLRTFKVTPVGLAALAVWAVFAGLCLTHYCIAHPFLLADNRHFTFYIWRRAGLGTDTSMSAWGRDLRSGRKYVLVPLSTLGALGVGRVLVRVGQVQALGWVIATALALVPSPLLEFRYFIMPILLLHVMAVSTGVLQREGLIFHLVIYAVVHAATLILFATKPFLAPDWKTAHFMW